PFFLHFTAVDQAVLAWQNLDEGAKVHDADHRPVVVNPANFGLFDDAGNPLLGFADGLAVRAGNHNGAVVLDVNLGAGFGGNLLDYFAALADDFTDFVGVNLDTLDTRSVRA